MTPKDHPRFFQALAAMGLMFSDELTKPRQKMYWDVFHRKVTIDEWEYACAQALEREDFHKVPLPATLLEYVDEYRQERREQEQWACKAQETRRLESPEYLTAKRREREAHLAEHADAGARFRASLDAMTPPPEGETMPVTHDPVARQAFLRRQLEQILDEEQHGHETA